MALDIGFPCNEEEKTKLKWVCEKYDALIGEISDEMERVKRYVMLKQGERNLVSQHVGGKMIMELIRKKLILKYEMSVIRIKIKYLQLRKMLCHMKIRIMELFESVFF